MANGATSTRDLSAPSKAGAEPKNNEARGQQREPVVSLTFQTRTFMSSLPLNTYVASPLKRTVKTRCMRLAVYTCPGGGGANGRQPARA